MNTRFYKLGTFILLFSAFFFVSATAYALQNIPLVQEKETVQEYFNGCPQSISLDGATAPAGQKICGKNSSGDLWKYKYPPGTQETATRKVPGQIAPMPDAGQTVTAFDCNTCTWSYAPDCNITRGGPGTAYANKVSETDCSSTASSNPTSIGTQTTTYSKTSTSCNGPAEITLTQSCAQCNKPADYTFTKNPERCAADGSTASLSLTYTRLSTLSSCGPYRIDETYSCSNNCPVPDTTNSRSYTGYACDAWTNFGICPESGAKPTRPCRANSDTYCAESFTQTKPCNACGNPPNSNYTKEITSSKCTIDSTIDSSDNKYYRTVRYTRTTVATQECSGSDTINTREECRACTKPNDYTCPSWTSTMTERTCTITDPNVCFGDQSYKETRGCKKRYSDCSWDASTCSDSTKKYAERKCAGETIDCSLSADEYPSGFENTTKTLPDEWRLETDWPTTLPICNNKDDYDSKTQKQTYIRTATCGAPEAGYNLNDPKKTVGNATYNTEKRDGNDVVVKIVTRACDQVSDPSSTPGGNLPDGDPGSTLWVNVVDEKKSWTANTFLFNNGSSIGIGTGWGTVVPAAMLEIMGSASQTARLRITDTTNNPDFQLQYGSNSYDHWSFYVLNKNSDGSAGDKSLRLWNGSDVVVIDNTGKVIIKSLALVGGSAGAEKYSTFKGSTSQTDDITYTLPGALGLEGHFLRLGNSGALSWASETDPKIDITTANIIPKWDGSKLIDGTIIDTNGNVAVGTADTSGGKFTVNKDGQVGADGKITSTSQSLFVCFPKDGKNADGTVRRTTTTVISTSPCETLSEPDLTQSTQP
ncbi:hypothetical protein HY620_00535 [Candidatus Uhrbacteria bacterium]|nr:hypothetical protein [Candidatus Uhrbacteria bacterium]